MLVVKIRRESHASSNTRRLLCPPRPSGMFTTFPDRRTKRDEPPTTKLVRKLKRLLQNKPRGPRRKTKSVAHICAIPHNVVLGIVANLSTQDQASPRNACTTSGKNSTVAYSTLHFRIIYNMSEMYVRSLLDPDLWLCDVCFRLHPAHKKDTPRSPKRPICAQPHVDASMESAVSDAFPYIFSYRHLQLYLKAVRIGGCPKYMERLLQRHEVTQTVKNSRMKCTVQATFHPLASDRRVVLHRSWLYRPAKETEPAPYWDMQVCPHQRYNENKFNAFVEEDSRASRESLVPPSEVLSLQRHGYAFCKAVQMAMASPNKHTFGACTLCRTDFSLKVLTLETPGDGSKFGIKRNGVHRLLLRTWQDLGGECAPLHPTWASHSHVLHNHVVSPNYRYCEPGTAWRLYEQECQRLDKRTESLCAENNRIDAMYRRMAEKNQNHHPEVFQIEDDKDKLKTFKRKHYFF